MKDETLDCGEIFLLKVIWNSVFISSAKFIENLFFIIRNDEIRLFSFIFCIAKLQEA